MLDRQTITIDANGRKVRLPRSSVRQLRDAAAADAGKSSARRDLSLVLERSLTGPGIVALQRAEVHALVDLIEDRGLELRFKALLDAVGE